MWTPVSGKSPRYAREKSIASNRSVSSSSPTTKETKEAQLAQRTCGERSAAPCGKLAHPRFWFPGFRASCEGLESEPSLHNALYAGEERERSREEIMREMNRFVPGNVWWVAVVVSHKETLSCRLKMRCSSSTAGEMILAFRRFSFSRLWADLNTRRTTKQTRGDLSLCAGLSQCVSGLLLIMKGLASHMAYFLAFSPVSFLPHLYVPPARPRRISPAAIVVLHVGGDWTWIWVPRPPAGLVCSRSV